MAKGQVGRGQISLGSRSNHMGQGLAKGRDIGRWARDNVKLHFFKLKAALGTGLIVFIFFCMNGFVYYSRRSV